MIISVQISASSFQKPMSVMTSFNSLFRLSVSGRVNFQRSHPGRCFFALFGYGNIQEARNRIGLSVIGSAGTYGSSASRRIASALATFFFL